MLTRLYDDRPSITHAEREPNDALPEHRIDRRRRNENIQKESVGRLAPRIRVLLFYISSFFHHSEPAYS